MARTKGFTLIELVMVIVILAILAVVAIPKYFDLQTQAKDAAEQGVASGVRSGITTYFAQNKAYPASLGGADGACSASNICFGTVLGQGAITSGDWSVNGTSYTGPGGHTFTYTAATGEFTQSP